MPDEILWRWIIKREKNVYNNYILIQRIVILVSCEADTLGADIKGKNITFQSCAPCTNCIAVNGKLVIEYW